MYIYTKKLMFLLLIPLLTANKCGEVSGLTSQRKVHKQQITKHNKKTASKSSSPPGASLKKEAVKKDLTKNKQGIKDGTLSKIKPTGQTQSTDATMASDNSQDAQTTPTTIQQDSATGHRGGKDQNTNQHKESTEKETPKAKRVLAWIKKRICGEKQKAHDGNNVYADIVDDMERTI
ncbi:MAG: hypothetical protein V3581_02090 [Candidatus Cardinium sp.]